MNNVTPMGRPNPAELNPGRVGTAAANQAIPTPAAERGEDRVELSTTAQLLSKINDLPDVRQDVIDRIRTEIDLGTYETDDKIDASIDALADDLV